MHDVKIVSGRALKAGKMAASHGTRMKAPNHLCCIILLGVLICTTCIQVGAAPIRVLLFTCQAGEQHESLSPAVEALQKAGFEQGWMVDHLESSTGFSPAGLAAYDTIVFLLTSGNVLSSKDQQNAFVHYIQGGGSFVGVHSAAETMVGWDWFDSLIGGRPAAGRSESQLTKQTVLVHDR